MLIIAATGHRPDKLGGYHDIIAGELQGLAEEKLWQMKPDLVIVGMAQGWDQAVGRAAHSLKIPFHAYVPCPSQPDVWPAKAQYKYRELLGLAAAVHVVFPSYVPHCMAVRNQRMVDAATEMLALWNGDAGGGTADCLRYARRRGRPINNCWTDWKNMHWTPPKE